MNRSIPRVCKFLLMAGIFVVASASLVDTAQPRYGTIGGIVGHQAPTDQYGCHRGPDGQIHCH